MKIISDFRDYYDCVQAYGQDQSLVYLRTPKTVQYDEPPTTFKASATTGKNFWPFPTISRYRYSGDLYIKEFIVGFCGKIHPVLELRKDAKDDLTLCRTQDEVDDFINRSFKKKEIDGYRNPKKRFWSRFWQAPTRDRFQTFFDECEKQQNNHEHIFMDSGYPIFVAVRRYRIGHGRVASWNPSTITFNAELKELEFYKIVPTAIAYQEIAMYLGGVLGQGNPPVPEVSNDDLIEAKGFDLKFSFRKPKKK